MTGKRSPRKRGRAEPRAEGTAPEETLRGLLSEVASRARGGFSIDPELESRLGELESAIKECAHRELSKPIRRENFELRVWQIRRAFKRAEFTDELRKAGSNLYRFVLKFNKREKPEYFKACMLVYEIHDNLHIHPGINEWAAKDGKRVFDYLKRKLGGRRSGEAAEKQDRKLLREQILWCLCYANELKREGDTKGALEVFKTLDHFVKVNVKTKAMPGYATRALIAYYLASIYRRVEDHARAEMLYMRAIGFYFKRSRSRQGELEEFIFSTRRVAMCIGLGIGWVNLTRGYLRRAENALTTARSLMVHIPDPVGRYFIEMLWGTMRRCRAGSDRRKLTQAIEALSEAREVFKERKHPRYEAYACKELALAYGRLGNYEKSEEYVRCVEVYGRRSRSDKLKTDVHVLRSRNLRAQSDNARALTKALAEAEAAMVTAESSGNKLSLLDALITRGEAKLALSAHAPAAHPCTKAHEDFEEALRELRPRREGEDAAAHTLNDKIAAVCVLRIAQCHVRNMKWQEANVQLEMWKRLSRRVEHEWVHELAARVTHEFEAMTGDFTVRADSPEDWNWDTQWRALQEWLIVQAINHKGGNREEAAKLIGLTRTRLGQVLREAARNKKPGGDGKVERK